MPIQIIIGAQWGDEGKGRIVDWFAAQADVVARFNGGDNAGHTVNVEGRTFKLHLVPSGAIHPHTMSVLGNGMVVNLATLVAEMDELEQAGVHLTPERLLLSHAAHLITPAHRALDAAQEKARGRENIGTTGRGIGPAYTDKTARQGLRAGDMLDLAGFADKVRQHTEQANRLLETLYSAEPLDADAVAGQLSEYARRLGPYITDTSIYLHQARGGCDRSRCVGCQSLDFPCPCAASECYYKDGKHDAEGCPLLYTWE